jgi:hypothetical protein
VEKADVKLARFESQNGDAGAPESVIFFKLRLPLVSPICHRKKQPSSLRAAHAAKRRAIGTASSVILQDDTGLVLRREIAGDGRGVVLRDGEAKATL